MEFLSARVRFSVRSCWNIRRTWLRDICAVDLSRGGSEGNVGRVWLNGDLQHRVDKVRHCGSKRHPLGRYVSVYWRWTSLWCLTDDGSLERIVQWIRVQFEEFKCRSAVGGNSHHLRSAKVLYHNQYSRHCSIFWARLIQISHSYHVLHIHFNIIFLSEPRFSKCSIFFSFPMYRAVCISNLRFRCYMSRPSYHYSFHHPNSVLRKKKANYEGYN